MGNLALPSFQHSKWKTKKVSLGTKIRANIQTGKLATYCRKIYSDTFVRHKVLRSEKWFPTVFVIFARLYLRSANTLKISTAQGPNTSLQNRHFTAFWKTKYEMVIQKANIAFDLLDSCKHHRYCWATFSILHCWEFPCRMQRFRYDCLLPVELEEWDDHLYHHQARTCKLSPSSPPSW